MSLTEEQLLMLNNLIYADVGIHNGDTVQDIVDKIERKDYKLESCEMSREEWKDLITIIENEPDLLNYTVTNYCDDSSGMRAACFVDDVNNPSDVNVIFRGTCGEYEWKDNGRGGYQYETIQQKKAADYVRNLPKEYGNQITVSGHSKGGNKAQYTTIVTNRVGRCISFDGQGFSKEFVDKYKDEIKQKSGKIISISSSEDVVNALLISIAGERIYIDCGEQDKIFDYHKPNIMLDENGQFKPETRQSDLAIFINEYSVYLINQLEEPAKSASLDGFINILFLMFDDIDNDISDIPSMISALVEATTNIDNYVFDSIGENYGLPAEEVLLYSLSIVCPSLFLDDFIKLEKEKIMSKINEMIDLAEKIKNRLEKLGKKVANYAKVFVEEISRFAKNVIDFFLRKHGNNQTYMSVNSNIVVDTGKLRDYSTRISRVNKRVVNIDKRLDALYWKVGLFDLWDLLQADLLAGYSWRLFQCINCLNETAADFESVERSIASQ